MKRAALALRNLLVDDVDIEGGLLLIGALVTAIAVGGLAHDAYAGLAVLGVVCLAAAVALARPRRTG